MTPLGLNLIMAHGSHFGPGPWDTIGPREDWKAPYYHQAGADGIGFDRSLERQQHGRAISARR